MSFAVVTKIKEPMCYAKNIGVTFQTSAWNHNVVFVNCEKYYTHKPLWCCTFCFKLFLDLNIIKTGSGKLKNSSGEELKGKLLTKVRKLDILNGKCLHFRTPSSIIALIQHSVMCRSHLFFGKVHLYTTINRGNFVVINTNKC